MSSLAPTLAASPFASSFTSVIEPQRQLDMDDAYFVSEEIYFFELILPAIGGTAAASYLFPLALAPQMISLSEPFAVDVQHTQNGGMFVERQGIVERRLRIRGDMGFWPLPLQATPPAVQATHKSFSRSLAPKTTQPLSGRRHLEFLQDTVFRLYGDLTRDPATAEGVQLIWHSPITREHWLVEPMSFSADRSVQQNFLNPYDIDLLVLDTAVDTTLVRKSPDQNLLQRIKDANQNLNRQLTTATAALQDLTAAQGDLSRTVHSIGATLSQVSTLYGAVADFLAGTSSFINSPFQSIFALTQAMENACRIAYNARVLGNNLFAWPDVLTQRLRLCIQTCEALAFSSRAFVPPAVSRRAQRRAAPAETAPSYASFAQLQKAGSSPLPTDAILEAAQGIPDDTSSDYPGTVAYAVQQGDSLYTLAARFLGSATLWHVIADANLLTPPLIPGRAAGAIRTDDRPPGGYLYVGQTLNIPSKQAPSVESLAVPVVGAPPDAPAEEVVYGCDLAYAPTALNGQLDLTLDVQGGLPDLARVRGLQNVLQAARTRVTLTRGATALYPELGLDTIIGTSSVRVDAQSLRLRLTQALTADPRVQEVRDLSVVPQGDALTIRASLALIQPGQVAQLALAR